MGKSKAPVNHVLNRGLAAYQQVLKRESPPARPPSEPMSGAPALPAEKPLSGLIKSGAKPEIHTKPETGVKSVLLAEKTPARGLLKSGKTPEKPLSRQEEEPVSRYRRTAQFLVLVGSEKAAEVLSRLEPKQVEAICREIITIRSINPGEAQKVLDEFRSLLSLPYAFTGSSSGGIEEARRLLYAAFGPEKGEAVLRKTVPEPADNPFDFLEDYSGDQLALFFRNENPAAEAMVLSRLSSALSAAVLANTAPERKTDLVRRIARLGETSPEVLERTAAALREKVRHFSRTESAGVDGMGALTAILKHSDLSFGDRILEELEYKDPALSRGLKDRLCTLEDIATAPDRPIEEKLRTMPDRDILLLLKNPCEAFTQKIRANLSQGREARIQEDAEISGGMKKYLKIEMEAAAREFLAWFRAAGPWLDKGNETTKIIKGDEEL